jgi:hypothetical protein
VHGEDGIGHHPPMPGEEGDGEDGSRYEPVRHRNTDAIYVFFLPDSLLAIFFLKGIFCLFFFIFFLLF